KKRKGQKLRFNCRIELKTKKEEIKIPSDYRRYISSLIKESFKRSGEDGNIFFEKFFSKNKPKPYTFSVVFPIKEYKDKFFILRENYFNFNFSSADYEFLLRIYNGLLKLRDGFKIFNDNIEVESFKLFLKPNYTFKEEVIFKTLSPVLIRNPKDGDRYFVLKGLLNGKKFKYAEETEEEEIIEALKLNLKSLIKMGIDRKLLDPGAENINIDIKMLSGFKLSPSAHSSNKSNFFITLPAMRGQFQFKSNPEIIKFLYETGIGARRSEGFGMVEVVK
ncbi:MAG: CRISPR-associated endoribonuclease Cas6, partial [Patescibacteria group bacterium]|nr:CRISPR-associated endoribonuclease Cas6 [Patescibacteria group bacterium]